LFCELCGFRVDRRFLRAFLSSWRVTPLVVQMLLKAAVTRVSREGRKEIHLAFDRNVAGQGRRLIRALFVWKPAIDKCLPLDAGLCTRSGLTSPAICRFLEIHGRFH